MTDVTQAQYDTLQTIAQRFGSQVEAINGLTSALQQGYQPLLDGDWEGRGVTAFRHEMDGELFPAVQRLNHALQEGQSVMLAISQILQQAEREAAGLFGGSHDGQGGNAGGSSTTGAGNGSSDGGSSGSGNPVLDFLKHVFVDKASIKGTARLFQDGKFKPYLGGSYSTSFAGDSVGWDNIAGTPLDVKFKGDLGKISAKLGIGMTDKGGIQAGIDAKAYVATGTATAVMGDQNLAYTDSTEVKALGVEGFAGYKDGSVGATVGANLVSVERQVGFNIGGYNISLTGEVGVKAELGGSIGKNTEIKVGPFSIGLSFGGAK